MENAWLYLILVLGAILCAYRMIVSTRILVSTIYLACISACVSIMLYLLGGTQVAACTRFCSSTGCTGCSGLDQC